MSLSRAEKLEKLKALRETNKNINNKNIEEILNSLDKYLENYEIKDNEIKIKEKNHIKNENKIKKLINKFNSYATKST